MFNELFQSINESIKKRNNPDDFLPSASSHGDVIHRGYLRNAAFPIRYSFIPSNDEGSNSGTHIYHFKDGNISGVVEINHRISRSLSGHETKSSISYENMGVEKMEPIDLHRMILPIVSHHVKSHDPDVIHFMDGIRYFDDIVRRLGNNYESSTANQKIVKKKIDPKTKRIIDHVKNKLNKNKES